MWSATSTPLISIGHSPVTPVWVADRLLLFADYAVLPCETSIGTTDPDFRLICPHQVSIPINI